MNSYNTKTSSRNSRHNSYHTQANPMIIKPKILVLRNQRFVKICVTTNQPSY